jgi:hypothetical protein
VMRLVVPRLEETVVLDDAKCLEKIRIVIRLWLHPLELSRRVAINSKCGLSTWHWSRIWESGSR